MSSFFNDDETLITFSDIKLLFMRNRSKIKWISIICGLLCMTFLLLCEPHYVAEATFKQMAKQNEIGLSLKDKYQQMFSPQGENATAMIMQSNEVLRHAVEELGMQVHCNPETIFVKVLKRIRDNLFLEFKRSLADPDPYTFRSVSYLGEKPLKLFLKLTDATSFQLFDQNKQLLGEGKLGEPFSCRVATFTVQKIPKSATCHRLQSLTIHPWLQTVEAVRKRIRIAPSKQDKTILRLIYPCRNRFFAADVVNQVMKSYQKYLKLESDESYQLQLAYLLQRQQELAQVYDEALMDHASYLRANIHKNGCLGVSQEIEVLSQPKNFYTSKLFDVDLELQRLYAKNNLDQKRNLEILAQPLQHEIEDLQEQLREAKHLLQCVETQESIPAFPSLLKEPKSAIALLVKKIAESPSLNDNVRVGSTIDGVRKFIDHLGQKRNILEENFKLQTQESNDFSGLNLATAQELLVAYTRERDHLQAELRELLFLRDQLSNTDFEVSSLGGIFNDSITTDLIHQASLLALQLKDDHNRSDREQARLLETLQTQKEFLSQYLFQTVELKKLRTKLLSDKITSLCRTTVSLLQSEKELLNDKLQEFNLKMSDLPEQWRRESLLTLKKEMGAMMLQSVSQLAETKNLGQHIFQANSKPLDVAIPPTKASSPKLFILSLFSSAMAAFCFYAFLFCKRMLKGFPVTEENLKVSGFPISGALSGNCNVDLSQLSSQDLETLRCIAAFLVSHQKKAEALVASCIGGKYPNYTNSLAELLSMRGLKVLVVHCVFDQVVHADAMPGLWQYLNHPTMELPIKRNLMFDHLPSGGTTRHATELIGSEKFLSFLAKVKQKYDIVLIFSSADATATEGHAFLPIADAAIVTVQQERKDQLLVYVDWAEKKGTTCVSFVYTETTSKVD